MSAGRDEISRPEARRQERSAAGSAAGDRPSGDRPRRGGQRLRQGRNGLFGLLVLVMVVLGAGIGGLAISGRPVALPDWALLRIETALNARLGEGGRVRLGRVDLLVGRDLVPRVRLRDVELDTIEGHPVARLPQVRASFRPAALLQARVEPLSLRVYDPQLLIRRAPDGALNIAFVLPGNQGGGQLLRSPQEAMAALRRLLEQPVLQGLGQVEAEGLGITFDDARAGQSWSVRNGTASFERDGAAVRLGLGFDFAAGTLGAGLAGAPASARLDLAADLDSGAASVSTQVDNVEAATLAAQVPALAWARVLDAPISGRLTSGLDAEGRMRPLEGALEIGRGAVLPVSGIRPLPFDRARLDFAYDPAAARLDIRELDIEGSALKVGGQATAWGRGMENGLPTSLVVQTALSDLRADPQGMFDEPVHFPSGAMDFRIELDPFRVTLGQLVLVDDAGHRLATRGAASASAAGWNLSMDVSLDDISHDRLLALWPLGLVHKTRSWLAENVSQGELYDVRGAVRLAPGTEPRLTLSYAFRGGEVTVLKTLPPVEDGEGYATIEGLTHTLVIDRGHVTAPNGARVEAAGTVVTVPDITAKPTPMEVRLKVESTIPGALSLLNQPPLELMRKAGKEIDLAEGRARAVALLKFPLEKHLKVDAVDFDVSATLSDVVSDKVIPGRTLRAESLDLRATRELLTISGPGTLDGAPFTATWSQPLEPKDAPSRVVGTAAMGPEVLRTFGIDLPEGMVGGAGQAAFTVDLAKGEAPRLHLSSDLAGLVMKIPEIGWSLPAGTKGDLQIDARLSEPPQVERLALTAPGLSAEGRVAVKADNSLDAVTFDRAKVGGWFNGSVRLSGRGKGRAPAVAVTGGWADLAAAKIGGSAGGSGGGGSGGDSVPISVALDKLSVSDTLALNGLRGEFSTAAGGSGRFTARVNGTAPVTGTVAPTRGNSRPSIRLQAEDAGGVFRAARIFKPASGGAMDLMLVPHGEAKGSYDGTLKVQDIYLRDAPAVAELLSAISVVGLLEQLGGDGIPFSTLDARFRIDPDRVQIFDAAAQGASLGVSLNGVYGLKSRRLELQGVVSPVYLLNAVGQIISRRGEGVFGINYAVSGTADAPKISVNPLSLLTPGGIREIFRAKPPKVKQ